MNSHTYSLISNEKKTTYLKQGIAENECFISILITLTPANNLEFRLS